MKVYDYIAHETERQSGTIQEALGMYRAYRRLREWEDNWQALTDTHIRSLAAYVKHAVYMNYRDVPVVFNQGTPAVAPALIPQAMSRLCAELNNIYNPDKPLPREQADMLVKEFLDIHPFTDGNGRVASLVWNFLLRTLDDPEPMPYFYGEDDDTFSPEAVEAADRALGRQ